MKKTIAIFLAFLILVGFSACKSDSPDNKPERSKVSTNSVPSAVPTTAVEVEHLITAEDALLSLRNQGFPITHILIFDEKTDLNNLLGRPGKYIGKADFLDSRIENQEIDESQGLGGGTIEVFDDIDACQSRYSYLNSLTDASLGAFGVNQYIYKTDYTIFRVSYEILPSEAKEYETAYLSIVEDSKGAISKQFGLIDLEPQSKIPEIPDYEAIEQAITLSIPSEYKQGSWFFVYCDSYPSGAVSAQIQVDLGNSDTTAALNLAASLSRISKEVIEGIGYSFDSASITIVNRGAPVGLYATENGNDFTIVAGGKRTEATVP